MNSKDSQRSSFGKVIVEWAAQVFTSLITAKFRDASLALRHEFCLVCFVSIKNLALCAKQIKVSVLAKIIHKGTIIFSAINGLDRCWSPYVGVDFFAKFRGMRQFLNGLPMGFSILTRITGSNTAQLMELNPNPLNCPLPSSSPPPVKYDLTSYVLCKSSIVTVSVISRKFLIKYYEYSFDFLIIIMDQLRLTLLLSIPYSLFLTGHRLMGTC